jgi:hypothetical protein
VRKVVTFGHIDREIISTLRWAKIRLAVARRRPQRRSIAMREVIS